MLAYTRQMTRITILAGGSSSERAVSLRSGAAVQTALTSAGYDATIVDPAQPGDEYDSLVRSADVVFITLHGSGGEDGSIQSWLEERQQRYIGCDSAVSAICFDKWRYKEALRTANIRTPQGELVDRQAFLASPLSHRPFVLKPYDGGSSVDTFIIRDPADYDSSVVLASFERHERMLLEELVIGQELTAGVLIDGALPIVEIVPPTDGEFDYENKYNGRTRELCPPESLSLDIQTAAQKLALDIHKFVGARDMSRTDMIATESGELYVLETNTIPGLTDQSLFPKAAAAAGFDMPTLVTKLVESARNRR